MSKYEEKKARIKELLQQQEEIENELRTLLEPERVVMLPRGFSTSEEVLNVVRDAGPTGITSQEVLQTMQKKYPGAIDREKVASALAYLKNGTKSVENPERGVYRVALTNQATSAHDGTGG